MRADLSFQQAPPFSVPARFLVSAPIFSLLAALVLLWHGPDMISHRWTSELLAVTHFLTLGFIAMSMLGALMQLVPVLMGKDFPLPVTFSVIIHVTLFLGSACIGFGWLLQIDELFFFSTILLGLCFVIFIMMTAKLLHRSKSTHVTRFMMMLALLALFITVLLGIYLAMGYTLQTLPLARQLTNLHLSWGLIGWVSLLIIAVAYQVIPMFQITDEYPALHQRWIGWLVFVAMIGLSMTYVWSLETLRMFSYLLLASCMLIFSFTTLRLLQKRRRQLPDLTMYFWQLAMSSLIVATLIWTISTSLNLDLPVLLPGVLIIHGFAMTTINGMMYKIIPFIIWLHISAHNKNLRDSGKRSSQVKVPHMRNIIPAAAGMWQFRLHLVSVVLMATATILPDQFYYPASLLFASAQAALLFNLFMATRFYSVKNAELLSVSQLTN